MQIHPPVYSEVTSQVAHLQQMQCLVEEAHMQTVTLTEMMALLTALQGEYGADTALEVIIQHRVGLQLDAQYRERQRRRREAAS